MHNKHSELVKLLHFLPTNCAALELNKTNNKTMFLLFHALPDYLSFDSR